jgi:hypothetical protein
MKKCLLPFATLGLALAAQAQLFVSPMPVPDAGLNSPAVSPGRTGPAELNTATQLEKHFGKRHHLHGPDALVWVDATGKTVGRYANDNLLVVPFKGQLAVIQGLQTSDCIPGGRACTEYPGGGARWNTRNPLYYTNNDCTGQAYSPAVFTATPFIGMPIEEEGTTYIYFFKTTAIDPARVTSTFAGNQCSASLPPRGFALPLAPLVGVIPALDLGAEPFMVK